MASQLLQQYVKLTEFLGHTLGPDYEVALHDLTDRNRSIVAIANSHVSGRKLGAPLTNTALKSYGTRAMRVRTTCFTTAASLRMGGCCALPPFLSNRTANCLGCCASISTTADTMR